MNLESRPVLFEDIGRQARSPSGLSPLSHLISSHASPHLLSRRSSRRQALTYGERVPPEKLVADIAAVTADDLTSLAAKMLRTPPSVAVYGDTTAVPRYDLIAKQFA